MLTMEQWKGVAELVTDAVTHGSRAVEKVHLATADRTFAILDLVPPVAPIASVVHLVHDGVTRVTHACVRGGATLAGGAITGVLGWAADDPGEAPKQHTEPTVPQS